MSYSIQPNGKNRIDITTSTVKLEGVKKYGKKSGRIAMKMGLAQEMRNEDGKLYYVNLRSLGKVWEAVNQDSKTISPREITQNKIKEYFKTRASKKESGETFIHTSQIEDPLKKEIFLFFTNIGINEQGVEDSDKFKTEIQPIANIISKLLMDKSNLNEVFDELKNELSRKNELLEIKDECPLLTRFNQKLTDFGKMLLIESVRKKVSPNYVQPEKTQLPNKKQIQAEEDRFERYIDIQNIVYLYRSMTGIPQIDLRNTILPIVSALLFDKSNLDSVYIALKKILEDAAKEFEQNSPLRIFYDMQIEKLQKLSSDEKLQFIEIFRAISL